MSELTTSPEGKPPQRYEPPEFCPYCGSRLFAGFYFCLVCATPYKSVETVITPYRPRELTEGELIEKKAPQVKTLFWTFLAVVLGAAIFGHLLGGEEGFGFQITLQMIALVAVTCVFGAIHWRSLAVQLKRLGFFHPAAWAGLAALAPLLALNYAWNSWLIEHLLGERPENPFADLHVGMDGLILIVCVFPAVIEEIAFRGLIQHWLQVAVRPLSAMVLASALFTVMHFSIYSAPYIFAVGMVLGWTKWKTGSLYPSMLIHFLHNLLVVAFFWPEG